MCNKKKKIDEPCACGKTCGLREENVAWLKIQQKKFEFFNKKTIEEHIEEEFQEEQSLDNE
mgnify:CR=1 FL=1